MTLDKGGDFCRYYKNTLEGLTKDFVELDITDNRAVVSGFVVRIADFERFRRRLGLT